jgi:hypothetical protein
MEAVEHERIDESEKLSDRNRDLLSRWSASVTNWRALSREIIRRIRIAAPKDFVSVGLDEVYRD